MRPHRVAIPVACNCDIVGNAVVAGLVEDLVSGARTDPVIVVSIAGDTRRPRIDLTDLDAAVSGTAAVKVLETPNTSWEFSRLAPGFDVYGGAIRLFLPLPASHTNPREHPLFETHPGDDPEATIAAIVSVLGERGYPIRTQPEPTSPARAKRAAKLQQLHQQLQAMAVERDGHAARADRAEAELASLRKECALLLDEIQSVRTQLAFVTAPVFLDPTRQLEHDIRLHWLRTLPEADRASRRLRRYRVRPDLVESMRAIQVDRERILTVIVDVLTRDVFAHPGRRAHQQRVTAQTGSRALSRSDGAVAWRCHIKSNSPSAPRLLWWELPDGTVELARVARHDDVRIR